MLNGLNGSHSHSQTPPLLQTIPELEPVNDHISGTIAKKQPPPTLPKPKKPTKVTPPAPPPKPKIKTPSEQNGDSSNSFQDETLDGSEVRFIVPSFQSISEWKSITYYWGVDFISCFSGNIHKKSVVLLKLCASNWCGWFEMVSVQVWFFGLTVKIRVATKIFPRY